MAERVEEIALLLEDLKRENEINNEDYTKFLTEIKNKLDGIQDDKVDTEIIANSIKQILDAKYLADSGKIEELNETLDKLKTAIYNVTDYSELNEQVRVLSDNFKSGFNSVVSFANKDADAKNLLLDRMDTLERAVRNGEILESLKQRTDELVKGYENFISDSNLRHGNMVSALVDLKNKIDDYSSKNNYVFGSIDHTISETSDKISGLESTVSSNLGNVTSKLYSMGDDIQKILNDGFDHLKYLSSNISEAMNSSSLDVKTTLEALRAIISDYSKYLKDEFGALNKDISDKITVNGDSQIMMGNDILDKIKVLEDNISEKADSYENFVSSKISYVIEFITALKEVVVTLKSENEAYLTEKLTDFGTRLTETNTSFEKMMVQTSQGLQAVSDAMIRTSDDIVNKLSETDIEEIQAVKNALLESSSSNLGSIIEKIQGLSDSLENFQNAAADNFSNYLITLKDLFEEFTEKAAQPDNGVQNNEELLNKISNLEALIADSSAERNNNFNNLKELIEKNSEVIKSLENNSNINIESLKEIINQNSSSKDEKLSAIRDLIENNAAAIESLRLNNDSEFGIEHLEELINRNSSLKDEKLDNLKNLLEDNLTALDAIKYDRDSNTNFERLEEIIQSNSSNKDEKLDTIKQLLENNANFERLEEIIQSNSLNKDEKLDTIKQLLENNANFERLEEIIQSNSLNKDEKLDTIKQLLENNANFERLEEIIQSNSSSKDEKLENIKQILENNASTLAALKLTNNTSFGIEHVENILEEYSNNKDEKFESLKKLINDYKNSLDKLSIDINSHAEDTLSELSEIKLIANEVIPKQSSLETLTELISSKNLDIKEGLTEEINAVKEAVKMVQESLGGISPEYDDTALTLKLSEINNQLTETSRNYEQSLNVISAKLGDYVESVEKISAAANSKLDSSVDEFEKIQTRFDELSGRLSTLVGNSGLIEILANIRQQFNVVIEEVKKEKEGVVSDVKTSLSEVVDLLNNNLYLVGQTVEAVYTKQIDNSANLVSSIDSGLSSIKSDFNTTVSNVEEVISAKLQTLTEEFIPVQKAIQEFTAFNFSKALRILKEQIELSYVSFSSEVKSVVIEANSTLNKVEESYNASVDKISQLEEIVRESININLDSINNALVGVHNIVQSNLDIAEDMQITFQADLLKLGSELQENTETIKTSITDGLQEIKKVLESNKNGLSAEDLRTAILPIFENDEMVDTIRGLNKTLADKLDEFKHDSTIASQDIYDVANSVSDTVNYILDTINGKFENSNGNAEKILDGIDDIKGKIEDLSISDRSDEIIDSIKNLSVIIQDIDDNLSTTGEIFSSGKEFKNILEKLDSLSSGINSAEKNSDIEDIKNELSKLQRNSDIFLGYEEVLQSLSRKIDDFTKNSDYTDIIENNFDKAKEDIKLLSDKFKDISTVLENKIEVVDKKIDIIAQGDDDEIYMNMEDLRAGLEEIKAGLERHIKPEEIQTKFDNLKEHISDTFDKKLDNIETDVKAGLKIENLINELNNKVDVIAMSGDGDILDEIAEVKMIVEDILDSASNNSAIEDSLQKVIDEIDKIDISASVGDIKETLISSIVSITNSISFADETEEIKDFVNEKTNELHHMLTDVKHQLSAISNTTDDMDAYTYTMQDIESDIAKLRLVINDMAEQSSVNELSVMSANMNKIARAMTDLRTAVIDTEIKRTANGDISENIVSISSRLNKFLLEKREIDNEIFARMENYANSLEIINDKLSSKRIEKLITNMEAKLDYTANIITILKNVMAYLGEWMDGTTETLSSIYDKCYEGETDSSSQKTEIADLIETKYKQQEANIENLQNIVENTISQNETRAEELQNVLDGSLDKYESKLNKLEKSLESRINEQETRLDRIEKQLDKISRILELSDTNSATLSRINELDEKIAHLSANIEKLAAYVE